MHPRHFAQSHRDRPAVISLGGQRRSYGELEDLANQGAQLLRRLGLKSGDAIALMIDNSVAWFDVFWAAQRCGLHIVPVATRLTTGEVEYILENSESRALVVSAAYAGVAGDILAHRDQLPGLPGLIACFAVNGAIPGYADWYGEIAGMPAEPIADEQAGTHMPYSSGTTGRPKGVRLALPSGPADALNPFNEQMVRKYGLAQDTVYLSPAPQYHAAPLVFTTCVQRNGGTVVIMERFDPADFLAAIETYRVTHTQVVPTMFVRLQKQQEQLRGVHDLSSLRLILHAAAPCPVAVKHVMIDWFGPIIEEYYGASEGHGNTHITSPEWLERPGSVGRASWGTLHICDEDGHELPAGQDGLVYFEGAIAFEYKDDPEKTAGTRNPLHPTWSAVGDIGHVDEEGYLFLTDRKDFMIISGGANIYPREIEDVLIAHPEVADVAVIGVPHPEWGEQVKAVVQPVAGASAGPDLALRLEAWCREHLSPIKLPRSFDFDPALPRADNGKLYKKALRARYWPEAGSAPLAR